MDYHHLYADETGESHWRTVQIDLVETEFAPPARNVEVSTLEQAEAFGFLRLAPGFDEPVHVSPRRQVLFCLAGAVEVTASDGETRVIATGDAWWMEDVRGKGHHTRVTGDGEFLCAVVQLP